MDGVARVHLNYGAAKLHVWGQVSPDDVIRRAHQAGYHAVRVTAFGRPPRSSSALALRLPLTLFCGLFLLMAATADVVPWIDLRMQQLLLIASIVSGGVFPFRSAFFAIMRRSLDVKVLMSVATLGAVVIGEWLEGATVILLFSLGELLEARSLERARNSVSKLLSLIPDQCAVSRDGEERLLPTADVVVGDVCVVHPGQRIPVDGTIVEGESFVNESSITGEAVPVEKRPGDPLFAGALNGESVLTMQADRPASESTLVRLVGLVEEAQGKTAPLAPFVARFARIYTPVVTVMALGVAALPPLVLGEPFPPWIYRGLMLLVLSSPCALVIAAPVATLSALANAARTGVVIKGGEQLEALADVDTVLFEKTGTLTKGRLEVTEILPLDDSTPERILAVAGGVEWESKHPIARAIVAAAEAAEVDVDPIGGFEARPGLGVLAKRDGVVYRVGSLRYLMGERVELAKAPVLAHELEAEGKTVVGLAEGLRIVGLFALSDSLKEESVRAIRRLRQLGQIQYVAMLTGDNRRAASRLTERLALDEMRAELLPEGKVKAVETWRQEGRRVAMVGDGVKARPALAKAHVGVAMGVANSDASLDSADIEIMGDDLSRVPLLVVLARRTVRVIRQNVACSIGIKVLALILLLSGDLTLWMAIASDVGATLLVTYNGLRLLGRVRAPSTRGAG